MASEVHALLERYDPWTGRAWLELRGPRPERIPIGEGHAERRAALRAAWPDRPLASDWDDGRFHPAPFGLPAYPVVTVGWALGAASCVAAGAVLGPWGAVAVAIGWSWPLVRLLDGVRVGRRGVRAGPPWALESPWHEVEAVGLERRGREVRIWVRGPRGLGSGTVPPVLVPALRARVRRLGGLDLVDGDGGLDARYASWRAAASGLPWGVLLGTLVGGFFTPAPWTVVMIGLLVTAGLSLLGAAVEARATGWGTGGVLWLTALHALILASISMGGLL